MVYYSRLAVVGLKSVANAAILLWVVGNNYCYYTCETRILHVKHTLIVLTKRIVRIHKNRWHSCAIQYKNVAL